MQRVATAFDDISSVVERGEARRETQQDQGMEGLFALVFKMQAAVAGGGTGMLSRIVEYNQMLERAEEALREFNRGRGV